LEERRDLADLIRDALADYLKKKPQGLAVVARTR
jgi:hypothetical protein